MRKIAGVLAGVAAVAVLIAMNVGGVSAAGPDLVITGPGSGLPNIRTFAADGTVGTSFASNGNNGGATVASGDVNGDGNLDIVTGTGPGVNAQVQVWSKDGKTLIAQANPFPGFEGGISVAVANEDETAQQEVIVAAGPGGGPHVKVLKFSNGQLVDEYSFMAYDPNFHGGVFVAGTGGRVITGPGAGGGPHTRVFRIQNSELSIQAEWMAYDPKFTGGVHVAAGAVRSSSTVDVVTGAGAGGGPHVKLWGLDGVEGPGVMAYDAQFNGGVWVGVATGQKLITGAGAGGGPHVKVWSVAGTTFTNSSGFMAYDPKFTGGVHVAGFPTPPTPPSTTTTTGPTTTSTTAEPCTGIPPICLPGGGSEETTTTTAAPTTTTAAPTTTTTAAPTTTTDAPTTTSTTTQLANAG